MTTTEDPRPSDHRSTAAALLPLVGGAANVTSVTHCMTRLRLALRDRALVRDAELRAQPAVLGVVEDGKTYQIVLGPGTVARVAPEFRALVASAAHARVLADQLGGDLVGAVRGRAERDHHLH
ncbi:PTS glucose/sucrose transporter subunit IIB, partial [Streptomyces sp. Act-28]